MLTYITMHKGSLLLNRNTYVTSIDHDREVIIYTECWHGPLDAVCSWISGDYFQDFNIDTCFCPT